MEKQVELKIEYIPISSIEEYKNNTRKHSEYDVEKIKQSIERYGFNDPIGIWSDHNVIVEGHGRFAAAKLLGMDVVPVVRLDHMTDEQRRQYGIAHNRTAEFSEWDEDALFKEISQLDFGDFALDFVFEETEENKIEAQEENDSTVKKGSLSQKFGIPPFSVIYTTKGGWAARKRAWVEKGIRSELGRGDDLAFAISGKQWEQDRTYRRKDKNNSVKE